MGVPRPGKLILSVEAPVPEEPGGLVRGDLSLDGGRRLMSDQTANYPELDPRAYDTLSSWLRAVLGARHESPERVSAAIGLSRNSVRRMLQTGKADRPNMEKLAVHFGMDAAAVRAFATRAPGRVAAGRKIAERLGTEHMRTLSVRGRAKAAEMTAEQRTAVGKIAGAASWRRKTPEERAAFSAAGQAQSITNRLERGSLYISDETRTAHAQTMRTAGKAGGQATLARHGRVYFERLAQLAGDALRTGHWVACTFCGAQDLLWRTPSQLATGSGSYHRRCYEAWRQTLPQQEKSRALGTVGWIRSRIRASGDAGLIARLERQIDAQIAHLVDPERQGRPPTLLADKDAALVAAELHDRGGLTAREIGELIGSKPARDRRGNKGAPRSVQELIRFGRALLQPPARAE
jgi:hypothetical protein